MERRFVVYIHRNTETRQPFYVGIGSEKRAHSSWGRTVYWHHYVKKYKGFSVDIVLRGCTWNRACKVEKLLIYKYARARYDKGGILVNLSLGGDGSPGVVPSESTRAKLSKSAAERYPSVKSKLIESCRGAKRSDLHKQILREKMTGRTLSQATRAKISAANKGIKRSDEFKKACRERTLGQKNHMFGRKRPDLAAKNVLLKSIPVAQYDKFGLKISEFSSISEASKATGCDESAIIRVCNGAQKTSLGYVWKRI
jgi:hypothetical protein